MPSTAPSKEERDNLQLEEEATLVRDVMAAGVQCLGLTGSIAACRDLLPGVNRTEGLPHHSREETVR